MSTKIEWTAGGETWNPLVGCTPVSPGCAKCYAAALAPRLAAMGQTEYVGLTVKSKGGPARFNGVVRTLPERLDEPLGWKRPRFVFVNSMSDLFHEAVPRLFIRRVLARIASCPRHTFQVLTKRPERMAEELESLNLDLPAGESCYLCPACGNIDSARSGWINPPCSAECSDPEVSMIEVPSPIPNLWAGTSPCNQKTMDDAYPHLVGCPAAVRFLSIEPLLGPVDVGTWFWSSMTDDHKCAIGWVILGCESTHGKRLGRLSTRGDATVDDWYGWARTIVFQCTAANVPVFVKQCPVGKRASGNPEEWPEELRIREFPETALVSK